MSADAIHTAARAEPNRWPNYQEDDFVIRSYMFRNGETLPELRLHYRTLGMPKRNAAGRIVNGVLLLQAIPAPAPIGCARASPTSRSRPANRSMSPSTS